MSESFETKEGLQSVGGADVQANNRIDTVEMPYTVLRKGSNDSVDICIFGKVVGTIHESGGRLYIDRPDCNESEILQPGCGKYDESMIILDRDDDFYILFGCDSMEPCVSGLIQDEGDVSVLLNDVDVLRGAVGRKFRLLCELKNRVQRKHA